MTGSQREAPSNRSPYHATNSDEESSLTRKLVEVNKLVQAALGDSGAASSAGEVEAAAPAAGVGLDAAAPSTSSAAATGGGAGGGAGADEASGAAVDIAEEYARAMQPLVTSRSMADKTKKAYPGHHWAKAIKKSLTQVRDDVALPLQRVVPVARLTRRSCNFTGI